MYISTTETAKKFNISKRRVQFLCKQNSIVGAIKVSGVWLIPDTATKPTDRRKKTIEEELEPIPSNTPEELISLQEACTILSISTATAKNWLRLGKLISSKEGTTFQKSYIQVPLLQTNLLRKLFLSLFLVRLWNFLLICL